MRNILLAVLLTAAYAAPKAAAERFTLKEAVELGLSSDNSLKETAAGVAGSEARLARAKYARYGGFRLKGAYTEGDEPVYAFASAMRQNAFDPASIASAGDPDPIGNYMIGLEAGVPLYTGAALTRAIKAAGLSGEAARDAYARERAVAALRLIDSWLNVLLKRKLSSLASETVAAAETELRTARMLREKGMVPGSDYYGAEAILSTLRSYKLELDYALELEKRKLGLALGMEAADADGELSEAPYGGADLSGIAAEDPESRRDIKALEKLAEISELSRKSAGDSLLPVVEAFGAWEANSRTGADLRGNRLVGLRVSVPLGDPAYFARKRSAEAETEAARSRLEGARVRARVETATALSDYRGARKALPIARETMEKARKSLELFRPLYRQGRQSVLEVLRAQAAVFQAESSYYEHVYRTNAFHARILLAADALDASAVEEMSERLAGR